MKTKLYIAGPMRGYTSYNFPAFDEAANALREAGYEVISPAELDRAVGFNPELDQATPEFVEQAMQRDFEAIKSLGTGGGIALLPGWSFSKGVQRELDYARSIGGVDEATFDHWLIKAGVSREMGKAVIQDEHRVTDASTGGQKGCKLERFDLIPVWPLEELARVYGKGALKYDDQNWRKGYSWGLSFAAMLRHVWKFWRGHSIDACEPGCPEDCKKHTNLHHLACAAWHCFTLMWFEKNRPEKDDRADAIVE